MYFIAYHTRNVQSSSRWVSITGYLTNFGVKSFSAKISMRTRISKHIQWKLKDVRKLKTFGTDKTSIFLLVSNRLMKRLNLLRIVLLRHLITLNITDFLYFIENIAKFWHTMFLSSYKQKAVLYLSNEFKFNENEDKTPRNHLSRSLYLEIEKVNPA